MPTFNGYVVRPNAVYRVMMGWRCEASLTEDEMCALDDGYDPRPDRAAAKRAVKAKIEADRKRRAAKRAAKADAQRNRRKPKKTPPANNSHFTITKETA
jgi:hypothetical protein